MAALFRLGQERLFLADYQFARLRFAFGIVSVKLTRRFGSIVNRGTLVERVKGRALIVRMPGCLGRGLVFTSEDCAGAARDAREVRRHGFLLIGEGVRPMMKLLRVVSLIEFGDPVHVRPLSRLRGWRCEALRRGCIAIDLVFTTVVGDNHVRASTRADTGREALDREHVSPAADTCPIATPPAGPLLKQCRRARCPSHKHRHVSSSRQTLPPSIPSVMSRPSGRLRRERRTRPALPSVRTVGYTRSTYGVG